MSSIAPTKTMISAPRMIASVSPVSGRKKQARDQQSGEDREPAKTRHVVIVQRAILDLGHGAHAHGETRRQRRDREGDDRRDREAGQGLEFW